MGAWLLLIGSGGPGWVLGADGEGPAAGATGEEFQSAPSMWNKMFDTSTWSNILPMSALFLCSVVGLAALIERTLALRTRRILKPGLVQEAERLVRAGESARAAELCRGAGVLEGVVLAGVIEDVAIRGESKEIAFAENSALRLEPLGHRLDLINTCSRIAPLLGLLGTVVGMIESFTVIAAFDDPPKYLVAEGVGTALLTTAVGLMIAIPCVVGESYFVKRAEHFHNALQERLAILRAALPDTPPAPSGGPAGRPQESRAPVKAG